MARAAETNQKALMANMEALGVTEAIMKRWQMEPETIYEPGPYMTRGDVQVLALRKRKAILAQKRKGIAKPASIGFKWHLSAQGTARLRKWKARKATGTAKTSVPA